MLMIKKHLLNAQSTNCLCTYADRIPIDTMFHILCVSIRLVHIYNIHQFFYYNKLINRLLHIRLQKHAKLRRESKRLSENNYETL